MVEEIKGIKSTKTELRKFGLIMGLVLGLLGLLFLWRGRVYYVSFIITSIAFLSLGLFIPILLKPVQKVWMILSIIIGWFMTRLILCILFYLVVTPIGLLGKLFGKEFLNLKFDSHADSYWIQKTRVRFEKGNYEKQF